MGTFSAKLSTGIYLVVVEIADVIIKEACLATSLRITPLHTHK